MARKKKGNPLLALRIEQDLLDRLQKHCTANKTSAGELVRRLLLNYLLTPEEIAAEKKARFDIIEESQKILTERKNYIDQYFSISALLAATDPARRDSESSLLSHQAVPPLPTKKTRSRK